MMAQTPELSGSIERLSSYTEIDPENSELWMALADAQDRGGDKQAAAVSYRRVLELEPGHAIARARLAGIEVTRGEFSSASSVFAQLVVEDNGDAVMRENLAFTLFCQSKFEESIAEYEIAASMGAPSSQNYAFRARAHHHLGRLEDAEELARVWVERDDTPEAHGYLALVEMDAEKNDDAFRRAMMVLKRERTNIDAQTVVGSVLLERHELEDAHEVFQHLVRQQERNPRAWFGLGTTRLNRQDFDGSIEALERAVEQMPDHGGARVTLGWAHLLHQDFEAAERVFLKATHVNRNFSEAHGGYASILAILGREDEARKSVRRAKGLDRDCFGSAFAESVMLERRGKRDDAVEVIENALSRSPKPGEPPLIQTIEDHLRRQAARAGTPNETRSH